MYLITACINMADKILQFGHFIKQGEHITLASKITSLKLFRSNVYKIRY